LAPDAEQAAIAAINGPANLVLSGARAAVEAVTARLSAEGVQSQPLAVSHAFHSPQMLPMIEAFREVAQRVRFRAPQITLISNVSGQPFAQGQIPDAAYWCRHVLEPVRFAAGMEALHGRGQRTFLELGPSHTLIAMAQRALAHDPESLWLASLRSGVDDERQMLESLGALAARGAAIDWGGVYPGARRRAALPTYPFQRSRYWAAAPARRHARPLPAAGEHPLLQEQIRSAGSERIFESRLSAEAQPYLADHRIEGAAMLPIAALLEMALAAGRRLWPAAACLVEDVTLHRPVALAQETETTVQLVLAPEDSSASFRIFHLAAEDECPEGRWQLCASGRLSRAQAPTATQASIAHLQARCPEQLAADELYRRFGDYGVTIGPGLRGIEQVYRRDGEALGRIRLVEAWRGATEPFSIHPALLDAALQVLGAAVPAGGSTPLMPVHLGRFQLLAPPPEQLWSHFAISQPQSGPADSIAGDLRLYSSEGTLVAELSGLLLRQIRREQVASPEQAAGLYYDLAWQPKRRQDSLALPGPASLAAELAPLVETLRQDQELHHARGILPRLEALSTGYFLAAFRALAASLEPGRRIPLDGLAEQLGVVEAHQRMLRRIVAALAQDGLIQIEGDALVARTLPPAGDLQGDLAALLEQYPRCQAELALIGRCGQHLAEVLRGRHDPMALLFPEGSMDEARQIYSDSPFVRGYNLLVQTAVRAAIEGAGSEQTVRVLEIGAGTGGTTAHLLPVLPAERTEYVFSDLSPMFTQEAQRALGRYDFVRYRRLDIDADPVGQGFEEGQHDLIVAANVLHATADLLQTLRHIRRLLAPGGLLIFVEGTEPQRFKDLMVGLTEGWWRFGDSDLRPDYPLIGEQSWLELLAKAGFGEGVAVAQDAGEGGAPSRDTVFLARASRARRDESASPRRWLVFTDRSGVGAAFAGLLRARGDLA
ncbi:MAG: methyltransferase, partial [Chloroflexales bacterium]|nr:methyltransferase [Chloroflexales bacterium]